MKEKMSNRLRKLESLNKSLKPPKELSGIFLPRDSQKQFDFMFIAEMPSMNEPDKKFRENENFNFGVTARDIFFQEMMVKYGVGGSYVTDIVKERDMPRQPEPKEIRKWLNFLLEEIGIIQPKVIIVIGKRTYDASFKKFVEPLIPPGIKVNYVFHYCSQVTRNKFERRFDKVIRSMKR